MSSQEMVSVRRSAGRIPMKTPLGLSRPEYEELRQQVLRRDRCLMCGASSNLEIHHQQSRSHAGEDTEVSESWHFLQIVNET